MFQLSQVLLGGVLYVSTGTQTVQAHTMHPGSMCWVHFSITRKKCFDEFTYVFAYSKKVRIYINICNICNFSNFPAFLNRIAHSLFLQVFLSNMFFGIPVSYHTKTRVMFSALSYNKQTDYI